MCINTNDILYFLYYFVILFTLFWTTVCGLPNTVIIVTHLVGASFSLWHCHSHVWVCCFETKNMMVLCMPSVLIHMSYFTFFITLSFYLNCNKPRVVGLTNTVRIVTYSVLVQFFVSDLVIVTCVCAVLKLQKAWSCVCHWSLYTCLTLLFIFFCHSIHAVMNHGLLVESIQLLLLMI